MLAHLMNQFHAEINTPSVRSKILLHLSYGWMRVALILQTHRWLVHWQHRKSSLHGTFRKQGQVYLQM